MLCTGAGFFLHIPSESDQRILHPGAILQVSKQVYTAVLDEENLEPVAGQDVTIFYEAKNEFAKQPARIDAVMQTEPKPVIAFQTTAPAVSAESRQCYRVSTVTSDLVASVEDESCPLLNVSATGFSVMSTRPYQVGHAVNVALSYAGKEFAGMACIQAMRELAPGRNRYGLHCLDDRRTAGNLQKGLHYISMAVQQQQLRRRAGKI